jgi:hypothetical protein
VPNSASALPSLNDRREFGYPFSAFLFLEVDRRALKSECLYLLEEVGQGCDVAGELVLTDYRAWAFTSTL